MAILCLSIDVSDLRRRIENILLGFTYDDQPFTVKDLGVAGAITVLLKDAIHPNLVQTTEGTAAFVHGGPFANIAHGCNSILHRDRHRIRPLLLHNHRKTLPI